MQDPYEVLGLSRGADEEDVKKRYRELARKVHPDKTGGEGADQFVRIKDAYDRIMQPSPDHHQQQQQQQQHDTAEDLFSFAFRRKHRPFVPPRCLVEVGLSESEVYHGCTKKVEFEVSDRCATCLGSGKGAGDAVTQLCPCCMGSGFLQLAPMISVPCAVCSERGFITTRPACADCSGHGTVYRKRSYDVKCPRGLPDGFESVVKGKGPYDPKTGAHSDLVMAFRYSMFSDAILRVQDRDVHVRVDVTLEDLLGGFKRDLRLYGETFPVECNGYLPPHRLHRLQGKGLPGVRDADVPGDIVVHIEVVFPEVWQGSADALRVAGDADAFKE